MAQLRSGDDEPSPESTRAALRDVIRHCIYGVDINPTSVELCKVNLWLESLEPGKPLSFLDAHIKCGNSLVGLGPKMALDELVVPDEAFNPVTGDDRAAASLLKKRNKQEREGQESLFVSVLKTRADLDAWLARRAQAVEEMPEDSAGEVAAKEAAYRALDESEQYRKQRQVADLWTAAFFWKIAAPGKRAMEIVAPTHGQLRRLRDGRDVQPGLLGEVDRLRHSVDFFHWPLEFAEVFMANGEQQIANGKDLLAARRSPAPHSPGFDCILGNPPWERIKLQEEEFFASKDPEIAASPNKTGRQKLIDKLIKSRSNLAVLFEETKHNSEALSKFVRESGRFPLTAIGDINTYALFSEMARDFIRPFGRVGIIVPTGIATDDLTKLFFGDMIEKRSIAEILGFENESFIFPGVHHAFKFCILSLVGKDILVEKADFAFFCRNFHEIHENERHFELTNSDIFLFNPNTRTLPIFRTRTDAQISRKIYRKVPILINDSTSENFWKADIYRAFDLGNPKNLQKAKVIDPVIEPNSLGCVVVEDVKYHRIYEAKLFYQFDHRYATYADRSLSYTRNSDVAEFSEALKHNPNALALPRLWMTSENLSTQFRGKTPKWLLAYRNVCSAVNEHTMIASILPLSATDYSVRLIFVDQGGPESYALVLANLNSLIFDYCTRQCAAGINLSDYITKQLPILPPYIYSPPDYEFVLQHVLELVYTAYDLKPFAEDIGYYGNPFPWEEERRALLRSELDAYYARLYGLNRKQLRYILDPADLTVGELEDILDPWEEVRDPLDPAGYNARRAASDFPGETFRVLKEKELRQHGEYRTRRLVLEAWERLEGLEIGSTAQGSGSPGSESSLLPDAKGGQAEAPRRAGSGAGQELPRVQAGRAEPEKPVERREKPAVPEMAGEAGKEAPGQPESQPMLSDFGLYKCGACGKMVMGFEKEAHQKEKHSGKSGEWKKIG